MISLIRYYRLMLLFVLYLQIDRGLWIEYLYLRVCMWFFEWIYSCWLWFWKFKDWDWSSRKSREERDKHNSGQTYTFVMLSVDRKIACKKWCLPKCVVLLGYSHRSSLINSGGKGKIKNETPNTILVSIFNFLLISRTILRSTHIKYSR